MSSPNDSSNYGYAFSANANTASDLSTITITVSPVAPIYSPYYYYNPEASVYLNGSSVNVSGYSSVYGYAAGSTDTATFDDSGSGDKFVGSIPYSYLTSTSGTSTFEMAVGFSTVTANAAYEQYISSPFGGAQAYLYSDGGGLTMGGSTSEIALNGTTVTANDYPAVLAFASSAGTDMATFLPPSGMTLDISSTYSYLSSNVNFDAAIGYQTVIANSPTGLAVINVASGETFVADPAAATLVSGTFRATVNNFTNLLAEGTSDNTATLNASSGQNYLLADGSQATLSELTGATGVTVAAVGFGLVDVNAAPGGTNKKGLVDLGFEVAFTGNWPDG
jgi:hypothetical protein